MEETAVCGNADSAATWGTLGVQSEGEGEHTDINAESECG